VRPNAVSTLNCTLCPLLAVSCGDAGLALFTLTLSSPRMDYSFKYLSQDFVVKPTKPAASFYRNVKFCMPSKLQALRHVSCTGILSFSKLKMTRNLIINSAVLYTSSDNTGFNLIIRLLTLLISITDHHVPSNTRVTLQRHILSRIRVVSIDKVWNGYLIC
jgi:hypothetical protein